MKKNFFIITAVVCGMSCTTTAYAQFKIGGKKINVNKVVQAGTDAVKAISLSDADIAAMSKEYMEWMDTHNPLTKPDTDYGKRLEKLTGNIKEVDGLKVNFGVYEVIDVNAFACGDGSVRICAGLMDIMTDDEVMAVVGHEIGHVIHTDSKDAMKNAYLRSAVKNAAGAASSTVSKLSDSELGAMAEALAGAQYSQKQETEADDYGFEFCIKNNLDPYAMYNALNKLLELSAEAPKESKFQKMFSSHPDTAKRVARAKEKADEYMKDKYKFLPFIIEEKKKESAAGGTVRQMLELKNGISSDLAKDIVKRIRGSKIKVMAKINGDELRISGRDKDDLQACIAFLKQEDIPVDLQFVNYR